MSALLLCGLEGSNPLGFLAALGTLRLCALMWRDRTVRLRWIRDGDWRPELSGAPVEAEDDLCRILEQHAPWAPLDAFEELGKNLTVGRALFEAVARKAAAAATGCDRRAADFAASFGSDIFEERDRIQYTDLCFITGSGHQDFLGTARDLAERSKARHLREALFGPWRYGDKGLSLRWDPGDAREYALRWSNPGPEGVLSVWGVNRLAFEALPFFPAVPAGSRLRTTGFESRGRAHEFTWPIWGQPASVEAVRSVIGLRELQQEVPDRVHLRAMGVEEVFRVQRVRIGQGANFKVSFRPAKAV